MNKAQMVSGDAYGQIEQAYAEYADIHNKTAKAVQGIMTQDAGTASPVCAVDLAACAHERISYLQDALSMLEKRLDPALAAQPLQGCNGAPSALSEGDSVLVGTLMDLCQRLSDAISRVDDINSRVRV